MRNLGRRIEALEAAMPESTARLDLAALSDAELVRLEAIAIRRDRGESIEDMPDDDLRFLAGIRVSEGCT